MVNLLTEDNLPSYHHEIASLFGRDGAWGTWVHRWTAEEGRHGIVMRDYLLTSRAVDPDKLEQFRMAHMAEGFESDNRHSMLHSVAYVAFQELATRVSHRNTGHQSGDPVCDRMLARIATDENLHMVFYRNLLGAAFELAPDLTMQGVRDVVVNFRMPGHGMPGFERAAAQMAIGEIYNMRIHHDDVIQPVLRFLKVMQIDGLGPRAPRPRRSWVCTWAGWTARPRSSTRSSPPARPGWRRAAAPDRRGSRAGDATGSVQRRSRPSRRSRSRSFSDSPPQTPNRSSLARAYSQARLPAFAGVAELLGLAGRTARGGEEELGPACAHNAVSCQASASSSVTVLISMEHTVPGGDKQPINDPSTGRSATASARAA